jgi:hypothetical protein
MAVGNRYEEDIITKGNQNYKHAWAPTASRHTTHFHVLVLQELLFSFTPAPWPFWPPDTAIGLPELTARIVVLQWVGISESVYKLAILPSYDVAPLSQMHFQKDQKRPTGWMEVKVPVRII